MFLQIPFSLLHYIMRFFYQHWGTNWLKINSPPGESISIKKIPIIAVTQSNRSLFSEQPKSAAPVPLAPQPPCPSLLPGEGSALTGDAPVCREHPKLPSSNDWNAFLGTRQVRHLSRVCLFWKRTQISELPCQCSIITCLQNSSSEGKSALLTTPAALLVDPRAVRGLRLTWAPRGCSDQTAGTPRGDYRAQQHPQPVQTYSPRAL